MTEIYGPTIEDGGVRFRLWAPKASQVDVTVLGQVRLNLIPIYPQGWTPQGNGWEVYTTPNALLEHGENLVLVPWSIYWGVAHSGTSVPLWALFVRLKSVLVDTSLTKSAWNSIPQGESALPVPIISHKKARASNVLPWLGNDSDCLQSLTHPQ